MLEDLKTELGKIWLAYSLCYPSLTFISTCYVQYLVNKNSYPKG